MDRTARAEVVGSRAPSHGTGAFAAPIAVAMVVASVEKVSTSSSPTAVARSNKCCVGAWANAARVPRRGGAEGGTFSRCFTRRPLPHSLQAMSPMRPLGVTEVPPGAKGGNMGSHGVRPGCRWPHRFTHPPMIEPFGPMHIRHHLLYTYMCEPLFLCLLALSTGRRLCVHALLISNRSSFALFFPSWDLSKPFLCCSLCIVVLIRSSQ